MFLTRYHFRAALAALLGGALHLVDVILHLGAHRTGTTSLQRYLEGNRDNLNEIGTEFWGPNRTRSGLFSGMVKKPSNLTHDAILRGRRSSGLIRMELDRLHLSSVKSLIVSEENMIGTMGDNLGTAQLYPDAWARLQRFADAFEGRCKRVSLSIRSYDKYWASALAFMVERGHRMPTEQDLDHLVTQPRRWRTLISEVASVFPSAEVLVWPFEAMVGQVDQQLALLNGGAVPAQMRGRRDWHNASAGSAKLRQILVDRGNQGQASAMPDDYSRWQPFERHHIAAFQAQYDEDIAWLRGGADGIATYAEYSNNGLAGIHLRSVEAQRGHFHDQEQRGVG